MPMLNPKINMGSRIVFKIAPTRFETMANFGAPSPLIIAENPTVNMRKGRPKEVMPA